MSHTSDPLERELQALHLFPPSTALEQRVAERLEAPPRVHRVTWRRPSFAGGLAAAVLLACAVVWGLAGRRAGPAQSEAKNPVPVGVEVEAEDVLPSWSAYQTALADSPEALDALLARHAVRWGSSRSTAVLSVDPSCLEGEGAW
jgi:hypothetical protein